MVDMPAHPFGRRLLLQGFTGAAAALVAGSRAAAQGLTRGVPQTSPEGITRTLLESTTDASGRDFHFLLDTFPPGVVVPPHRHPVVGLNYVLQGIGESQYEGEPVRKLKVGDTFIDHAERPHLLFRNPDQAVPLLVLLSFAAAPGQSFFIKD